MSTINLWGKCAIQQEEYSMAVSEILSAKGRDVVTANVQSSVQEVANLLAERKIGAIVVLDDKESVCGIVSERDVVREIASDGSDALSKPVSVCMTRKIISCSSDESIDSLMEKMTTGKFRHLPVIENGKLEGIISIGDVVKRKIEMTEREAEEMKRYIAG